MKINGTLYRHDGPCEARIELSDRKALAALEAAASGAYWVRGDGNGGIVKHRRLTEPAIEPDPVVEPHFKVSHQYAFVSYLKEARTWPEPAVYVQHICGYNYSPENYAKKAATLEGAGFSCLRSRRGDNGSYWEVWYLPGPWAGAGPLCGVKKTSAIIEWICRFVGPGTIEAGGEHWGLSVD
jgi:hypothetical protein